jgi:hypothetical protein
LPSACVRFEQQDFPGEEEERLKDTHIKAVADGVWQGERRMLPGDKGFGALAFCDMVDIGYVHRCLSMVKDNIQYIDAGIDLYDPV